MVASNSHDACLQVSTNRNLMHMFLGMSSSAAARDAIAFCLCGIACYVSIRSRSVLMCGATCVNAVIYSSDCVAEQLCYLEYWLICALCIILRTLRI